MHQEDPVIMQSKPRTNQVTLCKLQVRGDKL
jgi:hypothetical protein